MSYPFTTRKEEMICGVLRNCSNLYSFHWTSHGSLTAHVLTAVQSHCPHLRHFAAAGFDVSASMMIKFTCLTKLSLFGLSRSIIDALPDWLRATGGTLQSLVLTLQVSAQFSSPYNVASIMDLGQ
jgi:hypothetical protein